MQINLLDHQIWKNINDAAQKVEKALQTDLMSYIGPIHPQYLKPFRNFLEKMGTPKRNATSITILLRTPGGIVEAAEKMVEIIRYHYPAVNFVVPDFAMSAGTILCMSGDKIYMDYSSSLGPIDPQVQVPVQGSNGWKFVPALGYLDMVEKMIQKAANGQLSQAEFLILQSQDLAMLRSYEQARDLSVNLLKKWLVDYKFGTWTNHRTDAAKKGQAVTRAEKEQRAGEIAMQLGDNKVWHSHNRMIGISTLKNDLRLEIEDYSTNNDLRTKIRVYNDLLTDYVDRSGESFILHNRLLQDIGEAP
jgi:hypothetical protein